ncbi:MAG: Peptidyl-prolyl cis-trans isomerase [Candidatus Woesebacteria bacterium]|nr:MAG: Peptidyl-prolyl cis-trans isomerase [Candidatus Woesebacteria bacterium]
MAKVVGKKEITKKKAAINLEDKDKKEVKVKKASSKKFVLLVFFLLLLTALGLWIYSHLDWFVVATVNGKPIWRTELIKELEKRNGKQTASFLLSKALVYQEAKNKGINVSESEIKDLFNKYDEQFKTQGTSLKDALSLQGMTEDSYKEELKYELTVRKLLGDKIAVSDDEIKEYYDKNKSQFGKDQTLDAMKETIKQVLSDQKLSFNYQTLIQDLESKAKVKRFFNF